MKRAFGDYARFEFLRIFYFNLINHGFTEVIDESNEHTIVLENTIETMYLYTYIPVFNIKYIKDCFKLKSYNLLELLLICSLKS